MDDRYLATLEFFKITAQLAEHTSFSAGRELALGLRPSDELDEVRRRVRETTEAKGLLASRVDVSVGGAHDVRPLMRRAQLEHMLQPTELLDIRNTLISARSLRILLARLEAEYPLLGRTAGDLQPLPELIDQIGRCLDDDGRVLDGASADLARIRREILISRDRLMERLRRIVTAGESGRLLSEPIITERNGRYVIPLKIEYRGRIPGIVHDQSNSGATLFIEPLETVELNNRWRELQLAEQREIERILLELTGLVGRESDTITRNVEILAELDLALAKGRYSYHLRAFPAELVTASWPTAEADAVAQPWEHPLNLIRARHPLLPQDTVVPIDVYLGANATVLLITGPNTGGKTVSLKTVGLLAAMSQAGLHIPVSEGSRLPVFRGIYADIGDEQSIEQSLSTFSSHMSHIIDILHHADNSSLVLLDELGAGTDPVEGSALAQAVIHTLISRGCLALSTTHYAELKMFAFSTPRVQNASVEFDVDTLSPTFHLVIGLPGRSNALAIARRLGLDESIIEQAQALVSPEDQQADTLLARVKEANDGAERARQEAEQRLKQVQQLERELRQKQIELEESRVQILDRARDQARSDLERVRSEIRRLRLTLLQEGGSSPVVKEVAAAVEAMAEEMAPLEPVEPPPSPTAKPLQVGDTVYVTTLAQQGELLSLGAQEAEVRVGGFRLRTRPSILEFRSRPQRETAREEIVVRRPQVESPGIEIDLRGRRAEEIAPLLGKYLDDAYLAGLPWVHIIHGKGMGVLKEVVRQYLTNHPLVSSFRAGALAEGGDGITVVQLHSHSD